MSFAAPFQVTQGLWVQDNLFAWCIVPFDSKQRGPEERAQMLERLGIKSMAYDWRVEQIPTFDAEIESLERHHIKLLAWWFPFDAGDPSARATLETFKRHHVHPQLWVNMSLRDYPRELVDTWEVLPRESLNRLQKHVTFSIPSSDLPKTGEEWNKLPTIKRAALDKEFDAVFLEANRESVTKTRAEQEARVREDARRMKALVELAAPYGSEVEFYPDGGWDGRIENEIAVIKRLNALGVTRVGIVYNFSHARDALHDDTTHFAALWAKMRPYVVAVNITGTHIEPSDPPRFYPGQGDRELEMMRTIENSGWVGPVGIIGERGGDAEVTLRNYVIGIDWLAAELERRGSAGPMPFPIAP